MPEKSHRSDTPNLLHHSSPLGPEWVGLFSEQVDFGADHFLTAMNNLIREPNINSTIILRTDILKENKHHNGSLEVYLSDLAHTVPDIELLNGEPLLTHRLTDLEFRAVPVELPLTTEVEVIRRIIPRNPFKDYIINQTCLVMRAPAARTCCGMNLKGDSGMGVNGAAEKGGEEGLKVKTGEVSAVNGFGSVEVAPERVLEGTATSTATSTATNTATKTHPEDSLLVVYIPHVALQEEIPFYLPPVQAVGILFHQQTVAVHYLPFLHGREASATMRALPNDAREIRIAYNLMQTAIKHSKGVRSGYAKRVNHDLVVSKVAFQDRYVALKKKYSLGLVAAWAESTDPRKHVFEDIAIAAFLVELWATIYPKGKQSFTYRDLGCGNGLLVYLLQMEGYTGIGIDARARKSWLTYPSEVQACLKEQVVVPSVLVRPHPAVKQVAPNVTDNGQVFQVPFADPNTNAPAVAFYSAASLLENLAIDVAEYPENTFVIGNHSDELTCWIPLLGYPFMVIPCCSHALSGARLRYPPKKLDAAQKALQQQTGTHSSSAYAALVDHVEMLAGTVGWEVEREMLRIPSTRNAALIGYRRKPPGNHSVQTVYDVLAAEGGAAGWVENTMALMKKAPRSH